MHMAIVGVISPCGFISSLRAGIYGLYRPCRPFDVSVNYSIYIYIYIYIYNYIYIYLFTFIYLFIYLFVYLYKSFHTDYL